MTSNKKFAAFIITYQRNQELESTIQVMLNQTNPPEKILIIDNDPLQGAIAVSSLFSNAQLEYHSIKYNSGPAGAAFAGLSILAEQGFEWIGWVDDDNPPLFEDSAEILMNLASNHQMCGCVGVVGQYFNRTTGVIKRAKDEELEGDGFLEIDNIAGNMFKIVNAKVITEKYILPDETLFFGFEELDFDLRIQKAGFRLLVPKNLYKKNRVFNNRIGFKVKKGLRKEDDRLWREYYSTRNSMFILRKNNLRTALILNIAKALLKSTMGFRFGIQYGNKNAKFILLGLIHFFTGRNGQTIKKADIGRNNRKVSDK